MYKQCIFTNITLIELGIALTILYCCTIHTGYVQGMSYLAAILLMNIGNTFQSFMCLANLLNQKMYFQFYTMNAEKMNLHIDVFNELLHEYLPTVYTHINTLGVKVDMFLYEWLLTIYSRSLPLDITHRIWVCNTLLYRMYWHSLQILTYTMVYCIIL